MMRCLLHAADLGPEYWSFALTHAAYIKNRLPYSLIKRTPFKAITGEQPDLSNLRTFGCRIFAKKPGKRPAKLDHHTSNGIVLGYTLTTKNVYYIDDTTNQVKMGVHAIFDEAHYTVPKEQVPMAAQALQCLGYSKQRDIFDRGKFVCKNTIEITLTSKTAKEPTRLSENSNILQLYTATPTIMLQPGETTNIDMHVIIEPPMNGYVEVSHTGVNDTITVSKQQIYNGENRPLIITLRNNNSTPVTIHQGTCIAHATHHTIK